MVQRLLSDPFSFPLQYKSWLVSYLETSDMTLPISSILGLSALLGITGAGSGSLGILPAGLIFPYGGASAPTGSFICDGTGKSRTTEKRLYDAIGTTYGAPTPDTFAVPDLRDRVAVGKGVSTDTDTLGKSDPQPPGSRGIKHGHSTDFTPEQNRGWHNLSVAAGT